MENIYKLSARAAEVSMRYEEARAALEEMYEANGGEVTAETEEKSAELEALEEIKRQVAEEFVRFPDEYAAWYKNVEAQRNLIEGEKKAMEAEQKKVLARYDAAIKKKEATLAWIRENMEGAMKIADVKKFDKKQTGGMFSIYFQTSKSVDVNEELAMKDYKEAIDKLSATLPDWLSLTPKISKGVVGKLETLPEGFERKESKTLIIK